MTAPSPFDWLKDLCTHFDWLHSGAQALADGRPLPPTPEIPDHAVGEIMRAFLRMQESGAAFREERDALLATIETRNAELATLGAEAEAVRRELVEARAVLQETRHTLEDRQKGWDEAESKWAHERQRLDEQIALLDHRFNDVKGMIVNHARTLNDVAADLSGIAEA